jgi:uroporphyrinogen-III decarboxylase
MPEIITPGSLEIAERYGLDVGYVDYDVYNIEAEALGQKVQYFDDHVPDVDRSNPLIASPNDLNKIKTPNFDIDGRFPKIIEIQHIYKKLTGLPPALQFCSPFSLAANLRGMETLIMDILISPNFARGLFDAIVEEVLAPWILYQKKQFPNASGIAGADAVASPPVVTLDILKKWVVPYILRLREICGPEVYVPNWVGERYLKNPEEMLELKLQVSPQFLEGQDPDVEALGPELYKTYAQNRGLPLVLGVGASFMAHATPKDVEERVKNYIEIGGRDGQFALYLCNIGATTPAENINAAVEAVHTYGRYE